MKKATPDFSSSSPAQAHVSTTSRKRKTKISVVLEHLINGHSLNRFEAERLGDHCLNSTIATLSNSYGLVFMRHTETVPNRFGGTTPVTRYQIAESALGAAVSVLKRLENPCAIKAVV